MLAEAAKQREKELMDEFAAGKIRAQTEFCKL